MNGATPFAPPSEPATVRKVAVFDLDGTITCHDTLVGFLLGYAGRHPRGLWRLWRLPFSLAAFACKLSDRGDLKASVIRQVMLGASRASVASWAAEFCRSHLPGLLTPGAMACIERHRAAGDRLVLLSASVDLYVPQIGQTLGFDQTICTGISWNGDRLDGRLTTANRRGPEKRRCIVELRRAFPQARFAAYANAASDIEHLLAVDEPLLVNAAAAIRRRAEALGIPCEEWRR